MKIVSTKAVTAVFVIALSIVTISASADAKDSKHWSSKSESMKVYSGQEDMSDEEFLKVKRDYEYEVREPGQNYRRPGDYAAKTCKMEKSSCHVQNDHAMSKHKHDKHTHGNVIKAFTVYFDFDSAKLTKGAKETLKEIVKAVKAKNPAKVTVAGFADSKGSMVYNQVLSEKRAEAVANELDAHGVDTKIVLRSAHGESQLAVKTDDGIAEAQNRRVIVELRK